MRAHGAARQVAIVLNLVHANLLAGPAQLVVLARIAAGDLLVLLLGGGADATVAVRVEDVRPLETRHFARKGRREDGMGQDDGDCCLFLPNREMNGLVGVGKFSCAMSLKVQKRKIACRLIMIRVDSVMRSVSMKCANSSINSEAHL